MAPRAYWKGYLKLSLVSCPVALFPASTEREKITFNQINKKTGNRIKFRKVDAETGDEVDSSDIVKGYEVGEGEYVVVEPAELEQISPGRSKSIAITGFVELAAVDPVFFDTTYYLGPRGGEFAHAYALRARACWSSA